MARRKRIPAIVTVGAATPENQQFGLNDPTAWDVFLGGEPASSGVRITRETALTFSPWWRGVNVLSNGVGKLPLYVYRTLPQGKERDTSHPAYYPLRRKPNSLMVAFHFKKLLTAHALQSGNGYAYISRDGAGRPLELLPLDPDTTVPVREAGTVRYLIQVSGEPRKLAADEVFHIKGFNHDGLTGYSVFDKAREDLGLGIGSRKFGSKFFANNARPNVALEIPGRYDEKQEQSIRGAWERAHSGIDNAHRLALLWGGSKLSTFSINAREAQLLETREFSVRDIANWLGLPAHKLGDTTRTSYGSLEQENQDYLDDSLDPWLVAWEEEAWDKLFTEEEKRADRHAVEFDRQQLIRANLTARGSYYQTATGGRAWMTPDEAREQEGLNPMGGEFAELKDPANFTPAVPAGDVEDGDGGTDGEGESALAVRGREVAWWVARKAIRAAEQPSKFMAFLDNLEASWAADAEAALTVPAVEAGKDPGDCARRLVKGIHHLLLEAAGRCKAGELVEGVREAFHRLDYQEFHR